MSCTLAAPPGTWATMRSISSWSSAISGSISGLIASQPAGIPLGGTATLRCRPSDSASAASVGAANKAPTSVPRPRSRSRSIICTASSEWPPSAKKLSKRLTRSTFSSDSHKAASVVSTSPCGAA